MMTSELSGSGPRSRSWRGTVAAAITAWIGICAGFFGLHILLQERPQFGGLPLRFSSVELVQEGPSVVLRRESDDVALVRELQPKQADVLFSMRGRRDYRGLRTVIDMEGRFTGSYTIANPFGERSFVLFKCPHPRGMNSSEVHASGLMLETGGVGIQETASNAWFWSGELGPNESREIKVGYGMANVAAVRYAVGKSKGTPVESMRVEMRADDLPSLHFESSGGAGVGATNVMVWDKKNFLPPDYFGARVAEGRSLYTALQQLIEIGPIVSLLFLASVLAVVLARTEVTGLQVFTISAAYAFYFPLVLYLSAKLVFGVALVIAAAVPGVLLLNYARWLLGWKVGVLGGVIFLLLYQVFPTLAAFGGWNRGMVLLCLAGVTLTVMIQLQNYTMRQDKRAVAGVMVGICLAMGSGMSGVFAQEVQVIVPGRLVSGMGTNTMVAPAALVTYGMAQYTAVVGERLVEMRAVVPVTVHRAGLAEGRLFRQPVHVTRWEVPGFARMITSTNGLQLDFAEKGEGTLSVDYRVPIMTAGDQLRGSIPLLEVPLGNVQVRSLRGNLQFETGQLWAKEVGEGGIVYDVGVAGVELLVVSSAAAGPAVTNRADQVYGIRVISSHQLTVVHSDGSATHFAEYEIPGFHPPTFGLVLPEGARVISVSVDGVEVAEPKQTDRTLNISVGPGEAGRGTRRISLRLAMPLVRLGFIGVAEFELPQTGSAIGELSWVIVLPPNFQSQVISSGLELLRTPPDLAYFGEYGKLLKTQTQVGFFKNLLPPLPVKVRLKYYQKIPGLNEELTTAGTP